MESATHYRNGKSKTKNPRNIIYEDPNWIRKDVRESKAMKKFLKNKLDFKESSKELYVSHVTTYCYFHQKTIDELITEYKQDISNFDGEDKEELKVFDDVMAYVKHSIDNNQAKSTIQGKEKRIRTFLKRNKITFPKIDTSLKKYDDSEGYYTKQDLPDKKTMKTVINGANPKHKAIFAWVYTTGSGRSETANLTLMNFLDGISEFCNSKEPRTMINELDGNVIQEKMIDGKKVNVPVVPLIRMKRQKTNMPYYTTTTPECVQIIIDYIKTDLSMLDNFDEKTKLFGVQAGSISHAFKETNLKYGWGKRGRYNFFGCHRLRHNHYTQIDNQNLANSLEGRAVTDKNDKTYNQNLDDPQYIREKYKDHMHKFEIFDHYNVTIRDEEIKKLQEENQKLKDELNKTNKAIDSLGQKIDEKQTNIPFHKVHKLIIDYLIKIDEVNNEKASLLSYMFFDHVRNNPSEFEDTEEYILNLIQELDIKIEFSSKNIIQQHDEVIQNMTFEDIDPYFHTFLDNLMDIITDNEKIMKRVGHVDINKFEYVAENYLVSSGIIPNISEIDYDQFTDEDMKKIAGDILIMYLKTD